MAKIAFILLCHKDPDSIIAQAERLTAVGDCMAIHFDASAPQKDFDKISVALKNNPNVVLVTPRVKCGWGEWSLVQATLNAVEEAANSFPTATHFYMLSGDCMAVKSAEYAHEFLDRDDVDYIESFDYFESDWIKTGMKEERLIYRHYFNERQNKWLFYTSMSIQQKLGLVREVPSDLQMMIGSQWWCLRRRTIEFVLEFTRARPDVMRFFRTTWIPDETFFQTLVRHLVPSNEILSRTLTFLIFSDYGMPVSFYNDHYDLLLSQDFLFARKISPEATELKERLGALYAAKGVSFQISGEGRPLFKFLVDRGRQGRRFAPRFWEAEASLGRDKELLIVVSKKWHVAKRLLGRIKANTNIPAIDFLFNEENTPLPDLGGIQTTLGKRTRHRRALMRMLFDYNKTDRLIICIDPAMIDLIRDFYSDRATTKMLEIECVLDDEYLIGHAKRIGLAGDNASQETIDRMLPAIRHDVQFESDQIGSAGFPYFYRIRQSASVEENSVALSQFLSIPSDTAHMVLDDEQMFVD